MSSHPKSRIGVLGYGQIGQYLIDAILSNDSTELAFIWNRSTEKLKGKGLDMYILSDINSFREMKPTLVVEVAHPKVSEEYGAMFLSYCDYLVGSPTLLAELNTEKTLRVAAKHHGLYIPSGAMWGAEDIQRMADVGFLKELKVTMKKHPQSLKLEGYLKELNDKVVDEAVTLYEGSVRALCPLAPQNVNTMAVAAIAAHNLGFDQTIGSLISDPSLADWHVIEVEAYGSTLRDGRRLSIHTVRKNPALPAAVTGTGTLAAFLASVLRAGNRGPGVHLC